MVRSTAGLQAQDAAAAALSVRVRSSGLRAVDVERARVEARSVVAMWCMRGTLHLVAAEDHGWLTALFGPVFIAAGSRRLAQLGLTPDATARGVRTIVGALAEHGPLARRALAEQLRAGGIPVEPGSQAVIHLIRRAALEGTVCLGPRDRDQAYALTADWLGAPVDQPAPEAALDELARRHLAAFGPVTPEDLAAWSGLPLRGVREAWTRIAGELEEVETPEGPAWTRAADLRRHGRANHDEPAVRLLPAFDTFLLGYRSRAHVVAPAHARRVHPGGGILRPTVLLDGRAVATWAARTRAGSTRVAVAPFTALRGRGVKAGLAEEVGDVGRFLETTATLAVEAP